MCVILIWMISSFTFVLISSLFLFLRESVHAPSCTAPFRIGVDLRLAIVIRKTLKLCDTFPALECHDVVCRRSRTGVWVQTECRSTIHSIHFLDAL